MFLILSCSSFAAGERTPSARCGAVHGDDEGDSVYRLSHHFLCLHTAWRSLFAL